MTYQPNFGPPVAFDKTKAKKAEPLLPKPEPIPVSLEVEPDTFQRSLASGTEDEAVQTPQNQLPKTAAGAFAGLRRRLAQLRLSGPPQQLPPAASHNAQPYEPRA